MTTETMTETTSALSAEIMRESLLPALADATRAVSRRNTLPVLANVLLTADDNGNMTVAGTDLETYIQATVYPRVTTAGSVTVDAKALLSAVKSAPKNSLIRLSAVVTAENIGQDKARAVPPAMPRLIVATDTGTETLIGISAEEYPVSSAFAGTGQTVTVWSDDLRRAIERTAFAASGDSYRPILSTVLFELQHAANGRTGDAHTARLVAADNYRIAVSDLPVTVPAETCSDALTGIGAPIVLAGVEKLATMLPDGHVGKSALGSAHERREVRLTFASQKAMVIADWDGRNVALRLVDGQFPNYRQVIPTAFETRVTFDRAEFCAAVKAAGKVAASAANVVRFEILPTYIAVSAESDAGTYAGSVTVTQSEVPDRARIALSAALLADLATLADAETLIWESNGALSPSRFTIAGDDRWEMVVMPVRDPWTAETADMAGKEGN